MEDLKKAEEKYGRLTDKDVRIVYLTPSAVAASHSVGDEPENAAAKIMDKFVLEHNLPEICPGLRHYGFNHPNPADETGDHGYEMWVTIPDDMEVDAPLMKKYFKGGLYAARMIPFGAFDEWDRLYEWVRDSEKYDFDLTEDGGECMFGLLEEHLNYVNEVRKYRDGDPNDFQLDLLLPVKEKG